MHRRRQTRLAGRRPAVHRHHRAHRLAARLQRKRQRRPDLAVHAPVRRDVGGRKGQAVLQHPEPDGLNHLLHFIGHKALAQQAGLLLVVHRHHGPHRERQPGRHPRHQRVGHTSRIHGEQRRPHDVSQHVDPPETAAQCALQGTEPLGERAPPRGPERAGNLRRAQRGLQMSLEPEPARQIGHFTPTPRRVGHDRYAASEKGEAAPVGHLARHELPEHAVQSLDGGPGSRALQLARQTESTRPAQRRDVGLEVSCDVIDSERDCGPSSFPPATRRPFPSSRHRSGNSL